MSGIGIAKKGLGLLKKKIKSGSKLRKGIRKLPFGKFIDFPLEVATKQKKAAGVGAGAAVLAERERSKNKR